MRPQPSWPSAATLIKKSSCSASGGISRISRATETYGQSWPSEVSTWRTPQSCAGCSGTSRSLLSGGSGTRPIGRSWRVDETYIKIRGRWGCLYRGVDKGGQTIDFFLRARRDIAAAKWFLQRAVEKCGAPQKSTLDGYAASQVAGGELQAEGGLPATLLVRTSRYRNNVTEQGHRRVKQRVSPMLGFRRFGPASIPISGIELIPQIKENRFEVSAVCSPLTRPTTGLGGRPGCLRDTSAPTLVRLQFAHCTRTVLSV